MADTAYQDLLKDTSESKENGDYFLVTITDLDPNTSYPIQFRWMYKDKKINDNWSNAKIITTPGESEPNTPTFGLSNVDVTSPEKIIITWDGTSDDGNGVQITNYDRVDVYIDGAPFDGTKVAYSFKAPGTATISAPAGTYQIVLYAVSKTGKLSPVSDYVEVDVTAAGEIIQNPTNPNGFSINRVLGGIEVVWAGTYANGTFTGFQAIKLYVGNSATATSGTYTDAGVMTGNNVRNSIIIPVDGTYLRYDQPVYIHAAAINKNGLVGTLQQNVANDSLGAKTAVASDLANQIITNAKLVDDAVTAAKIATSAITETKIATDAVTSSKIIANAVTADKIVSSAITADKIATNAITAGKILAGEIDVTKLAAGTISVNNLSAGTISSSSYIRAGSTSGGARVEISTANISGGPSAGFYIYNSAGTAILSAPLTGGLTITGGGTFTGDLSAGSGSSIFISDSNGIYLGSSTWAGAANTFRVSRSGALRAESGTIGGWTLGGTFLQGTNLKLDTSGITVGSTSSPYFDITPTALTHRNADGTPSGKFTLTMSSGNVSISGMLTAGNLTDGTTTISGDNILTGTITGRTISGGQITGASINITGESFSSASNDAEGAVGSNNGQPNAFTSSYVREGITNLGINGVSLMSANSAGVISSWYPYYDGVVDLGIKSGATYNTYRWRNLRLTGSAYFGGDGSTNSVSPTLDSSGGALTKIFSTGAIYANTLNAGSGVTTGTGIVQNSSGYLKVNVSSRRYKENIIEISPEGYLEALMEIKPVNFNYINENEEEPTVSGLIAEDLDLVTKFKGVVNYDQDGLPLSIAYDRMSALLVLAIQEIKNKLDLIEQRLDALEA